MSSYKAWWHTKIYNKYQPGRHGTYSCYVLTVNQSILIYFNNRPKDVNCISTLSDGLRSIKWYERL